MWWTQSTRHINRFTFHRRFVVAVNSFYFVFPMQPFLIDCCPFFFFLSPLPFSLIAQHIYPRQCVCLHREQGTASVSHECYTNHKIISFPITHDSPWSQRLREDRTEQHLAILFFFFRNFDMIKRAEQKKMHKNKHAHTHEITKSTSAHLI